MQLWKKITLSLFFLNAFPLPSQSSTVFIPQTPPIIPAPQSPYDNLKIASSQALRVYTFRLKAGQDLLHELQRFARDYQIQYGLVFNASGILGQGSFEPFQGKPKSGLVGKFEILSLSGSLSASNDQLSITFSDSKGKVYGGRLTYGCLVNNAAEVAIISF